MCVGCCRTTAMDNTQQKGFDKVQSEFTFELINLLSFFSMLLCTLLLGQAIKKGFREAHKVSCAEKENATTKG